MEKNPKMLKAEEKIIKFIDSLIPYIGVLFVLFAALIARWMGKNYVGTDFHYTIYDVKENVCPLLYRTVAFFLTSHTGHVIMFLKFLIYLGDAACAFLGFILIRKVSEDVISAVFWTAVVFLLNPVILMNGIAAMKPDSICMAFLLAGLLLGMKGHVNTGFAIASLSIFVSHLYVPVIIGALVWYIIRKRKTFATPICITAVMLFASFMLEMLNRSDGYYFCKVFFYDRFHACNYASVFDFAKGTLLLYGYLIPAASIIPAIRNRKYRIPALIIHITFIMFSGWEMTKHFAI